MSFPKTNNTLDKNDTFRIYMLFIYLLCLALNVFLRYRYNLITDYLLNLLQHTFINAKLNQRNRRNSIERQSIGLNSAERRLQNKKKEQSFSSVMMKPTFERSMMTMSFLMFGVFIIQVVQVNNKIHFYNKYIIFH